MRYALLLDTETTGLDPTQDRCIEVACTLYDLRLACSIMLFSSLMRSPENGAQAVNKIDVLALQDAPGPLEVWARVSTFVERADMIVAHRAEFDRQFVVIEAQKPWVCAKVDVEWPNGRRGDHLVHLALDLGLGVASAHRAAADVDLMARILTRVAEMGHPLETIFERALRPKKKFVSLAPYERRQEVKERGFLWDAERKQWYRHMPPEDTAALPFAVREA